MRHREALAVAAVALFGLAGCADRPNNLETYYDDPTPATTPSRPPVTSSAAPSPLAAPPATSRTPDNSVALDAALLTDADVADEGVHSGSGKASGCLAGSAEATRKSATWLYPSGSVLRHEVSAEPGRTGTEVVTAAECPGKPWDAPAQQGVDGQRAWCAGATCTVLLAKGKLVSTLSVAASNEARARDAATRLLPIVAAKLAAQP